MQQLNLSPEDHQQIANIIIQSAQASNEIQQAIYKQISELSNNPLFLNHLVVFFVDESKPVEFRYRAGIILKSAIGQTNFYQVPQINMQHLEQTLMQCFTANLELRKTTSLLISSLITEAGLQKCNQLLQFLTANLQSTSSDALLLSVDCLSKIIEDLKHNSENVQFYDTKEGLKLMESLIAEFLQLLQKYQTNAEILHNAINFLNFNVFFMPSALSQNIKYYLEALILNSQSQNQQVRLRCIQGFQALIETKRDYMNQHIQQIVDTTIKLLMNDAPLIVKNVTIFLTDYLRIDDDEFLYQLDILKPYVTGITPKIIHGLQLTKTDMINIMPTFDAMYAQKNDPTAADDDEENDEDAKGEYTLRKVSGQLLEKLCDYYGEQTFEGLKTVIEPMLMSQDWKLQEAALLCFGTVATSLYQLLKPGLPKLMEFLFAAVQSHTHYIRSTAIWSIAQFTQWIQEIAPTEQQFIQQYLTLLFRALDDPEKITQESACTALNKLAQDAQGVLDPYLEQVLGVYGKAIEKDDIGISTFIYGSLTSVIENVSNIVNQKYADFLLSKLTSRLDYYKSDDFNICPLLECLSVVLDKFQNFTYNYLQVIYTKIITCIQAYIHALHNNDTKTLYQKKQIFMRSIDVLSNMVYILKLQFLQLSQNTELIESILFSLNDQEQDVKQYAVSFLGELAKSCPQLIADKVDNIILILCQNVYDPKIDPVKSYLSLTNNAIWALSEIANSFPQHVSPHSQDLIMKTISLISTPKIHRHIASNFAVALTRFAKLNPQYASSILNTFFKKVCLILSESKNEDFADYKNEAFSIFFQLILLNPAQAFHEMNYLIYSFTQFQWANASNQEQFKRIAQDYKNNMSEIQWEQNLTSGAFPPAFRVLLQQKYGL